MPINDNVFTFDTSSFEKGIRNISNSMAALPKTANRVASNMNQPFERSIKKVKGLSSGFKGVKNKLTGLKNTTQNVAKKVIGGIKNMAISVGVLALAFKGVQNILGNMPEIGKAFGIAKDIFMKNFLFPLRKFVFPYLQRLLDWVRTHRLMFVRWGQIVVNVFKVIVDQVRFAIDIGKKLVQAFKGFFERTFGVSVKNMTELMNILTFKFAVIMTFLQGIIANFVERFSPALQVIGNIFKELITWIGKFSSGFLQGLGEIDKRSDILNEFKKTLEAIIPLIKELTPILEPLGKALGLLFGEFLVTGLRLLQGTLLSVMGIIQEIKKLIGYEAEFDWNKVINALSGTTTEKKMMINGKSVKIKDGVINSNGNVIKTSPTQTIMTKKVKDAIIKNDGTVIETDPKDNLIATKNKVMLSSSSAMTPQNEKMVSFGNINIDFSGMQILLPTGTKEDAIGAAENIVETIRIRLQDELSAIGEY